MKYVFYILLLTRLCVFQLQGHLSTLKNLLASLLFSSHSPCKSSAFNSFLPTFNYLNSMSFPVYPLFTILRQPFLFWAKEEHTAVTHCLFTKTLKNRHIWGRRGNSFFFLFPFLSRTSQKCRKLVKLVNILFPFRKSI